MERHHDPCAALPLALAVSALTLCIAPTSAAQSVWTQTNGPYGGYIQGLLATPTGAIFAGLSGGGVYRFDPVTETWAASGFQPGYVYNLEHGDGVVYATYSDRLYRSDDNGGTWVTDGMPAAQLAVRGETIFTGWGRSICRSRDGGRTWTRINGAVPDTGSIDSVGLRGTTVFYAASRQGVWRSNDDGDTWAATSLEGTTNIRSWEFIHDVILAHATYFLHRSTDDGQTWTQHRDITATGYGSRSVLRVGGMVYATGGAWVYASPDDGETWTRLPDAGLGNTAPISLARSGSHLYAGTWGRGVYRLRDGADTWEWVSRGLVAAPVRAMAAIGDTVFAGVDGAGAWKSTDQGETWVLTGLERVTSAGGDELIAMGDALFAGNWDGLYRSTDGGAEWTQLSDRSVVGLGRLGARLFLAGSSRLYVTDDNGRTFRDTGAAGRAVSVDSARGTAYAYTDSGTAWESEDAGQTWARVDPHGLAVALDGTRAFGGTLVSNPGGDLGLTWLYSDALPFASLTATWRARGVLYAGLRDAGAYRSQNEGRSWGAAGAGEVKAVFRTSFASTRTAGFLGAFSSGVYRVDLPADRRRAEVPLPAGQSLIGVPLSGDRLTVGGPVIDGDGGLAARHLIQAGATLVVRMEGGRFTPLLGASGQVTYGTDFELVAGEAYIVSFPAPVALAVEGVSPGVAPSPARVQAASAFAVVGPTAGRDQAPARIQALRTGAVAGAVLGDDGRYIGVFVDLGAGPVVTSGDALRLLTDGDDMYAFAVTGEDVRRAYAVAEGPLLPASTRLLPNYPNPFNPETWLPFELSTPGPVAIDIYDAMGRLVRSLDLGSRDAGYYQRPGAAARWDGATDAGEPAASGMYTYHLRSGDAAPRRMVVLR